MSRSGQASATASAGGGTTSEVVGHEIDDLESIGTVEVIVDAIGVREQAG
jgi:hypothetical protein